MGLGVLAPPPNPQSPIPNPQIPIIIYLIEKTNIIINKYYYEI
jgi:hypothetical protein